MSHPVEVVPCASTAAAGMFHAAMVFETCDVVFETCDVMSVESYYLSGMLEIEVVSGVEAQVGSE